MKEFDLINFIQEKCTTETSGTLLGIGDDAAILQASNNNIVISTDTLVAGTHFKHQDNPVALGHKSLAVSFSDMAAMGAMPKWVLLNLTLPQVNPTWLSDFTKGFSALLDQYSSQLIGGDTTQGPLSITVTVLGEAQNPVRRSTAQINDLIVVSGELGSAAFALNMPNQCAFCDQQLHQPNPRLDISEKVKHIATSMIDVSDGLLADLTHICHASKVGAEIELSQLPVNETVKKDSNWVNHALSGGDDYQLCFTINEKNLNNLPTDCSIIGTIISGNEVKVFNLKQLINTDHSGFEHFKNDKQ